MQLDHTLLSRLLQLDDEQLWPMLRAAASGVGIPLQKTPPPVEQFSRLRKTLSSLDNAEIQRLKEILTVLGDRASSP